MTHQTSRMTEPEEAFQTGEVGFQEQREAAVYQAAYELYCRNPDWVAFFREVLGLNGLVRQTFTSRESLAAFEKTPTYARIQQMLARLRDRNRMVLAPKERTQVITVRLPKALHEALRAEAHEHRTSMNQLCISKLLQFIDAEMVPSDS